LNGLLRVTRGEQLGDVRQCFSPLFFFHITAPLFLPFLDPSLPEIAARRLSPNSCYTRPAMTNALNECATVPEAALVSPVHHRTAFRLGALGKFPCAARKSLHRAILRPQLTRSPKVFPARSGTLFGAATIEQSFATNPRPETRDTWRGTI
jgi:hypothetical protein